MAKGFSELVIEGPFGLVKGFLMGFIYGSGKEYNYFFHRKEGIRRETFKEILKELFEYENYVHVCLENEAVAKFSEAIDYAHEKIGLSVKSAYFSFSYELFNEELSGLAKKAR